jgi:8-oxo-dGTP pyrophosphatase MutT (NUDIX family)
MLAGRGGIAPPRCHGLSLFLEDRVNDPSLQTWIADIRRRADQPPATTRVPWRANGVECGSIEPALAKAIAQAGLPLVRHGTHWSLHGDPDVVFEQLARWLHERGHATRWRDERLDVVGDGGAVHGAIERAVVRALGIATRAVHLVGTTSDGGVWVQRRALDKAVDPGLLDTLVGGLAAAGESNAQTLERETWEEAGLRIDALRGLTHFGHAMVRRPLGEEGYMVERIEMFEAEVPDGTVPVNQDGEVMDFERMTTDALVAGMQARQFTFEATLIHVEWLQRHGLI